MQSPRGLPAFALIAAFGLAVSAAAQTQPAAPADLEAAGDQWSFAISPYAWATAISGNVGIKGVQTHVSKDVGQVISDLDGALMASGEARCGDFSLITDIVWAQLSGTHATPRDLLFSGAKLKMDEILWSAYGGYSLYRNARSAIDALAGFRLAYIDSKLTLKEGLAAERSDSISRTWVDPVIGLRGHTAFTEDWYGELAGDLGGFNASSYLTWQLLGLAGYNITETVGAAAGYRALGYTHNRDDFEFNVNTLGPFIGLQGRF